MVRNSKNLIAVCLLIFLISGSAIYAQDHVASETWLMPGINYKFSDKINLIIEPTWIPQPRISYGYGQTLININKHVTLSAGYMFIKVPERNGLNVNQSTLLNGAIFSFPFNKWSVDNRSLAWNHFINNSKDVHQFRSRFRLTHKTKLQSGTLRVYVFDEVTFNINSEMPWSRNRFGQGANIDCLKGLIIDLSWARQNDVGGAKVNMLFVSVMILLSQH